MSAPFAPTPPPPPETGGGSSTRTLLIVAAAVLAIVVAVGAIVVVAGQGSDGDSASSGRDRSSGASADDDEDTTTSTSSTTTSTSTSTTTSSTTTTTRPPTTTAPPQPTDVGIVRIDAAPSATTTAVAGMFDGYFSAINAHDFPLAHSYLSSSLQADNPIDQMADDAATTYDSDIVLVSVSDNGDGRLLAVVTFTSQQDAADGPNGLTCATWRLNYKLVASGSSWLIDASPGDYAAC